MSDPVKYRNTKVDYEKDSREIAARAQEKNRLEQLIIDKRNALADKIMNSLSNYYNE